MENPIPPILPEGFFRTTEEVYEEVANYPIVPPEKLYEYWQVYTTTFRRLEDPTASRLEAFWWHVMGSDRRFLSGKALAKMFEEISKGPSFTPLRGPSNRFHISVPRITQEQVDNAGYGTKSQTEVSQGPVDVPSKPAAEKHTTKDTMASSSSRPPPPHPILKKSRGPSTSGPRPTARFVSPHDSEDEASKDNDTSSGSTAATGMQMRRPAKSPVKGEKRSTPTGRKYTASSAAKRHSRPVLTRRPSSQSSVDARGSPAQATAPMMARSQSNIETQHHRPRELHLGRPLPQSMITPKSTPVAKKAADVAVQVQFDSESVTAQGGGDMDRDLPDSITIASRPSSSSLYTPTQPSPTPAPFLGRSKSQLTLLLEKMDQGKPKSNRGTKGKEHGS
ncbi:hypothetical protein NKR19_g6038 [Coniochaeta hoffmannii]|uniref:Nitrogen regulatory protein areA GATA-like domain-containing protein n=1 Tax=Coniochaeta hoffmannii TaxID=91930 RepID=A0AA38RE29_9PEZI|nr:hypothetical protein NKR19_g6038 [Coniochaeta hoffmannii]